MIGVFDSGAGGLSIIRLLKKEFPKTGFLYLGDTAHFPYGEKSVQAIQDYATKNTRFLIKKGAKIIIIACHTASALATDFLKQEFPQVSIFDVITPTIEEIRDKNIKKVGIIGTRGTIKSGIYQKKLKGIAEKIVGQPCPLLVSLVEEGWIDRTETVSILKHYLKFLEEEKLEALVLSCTHYSLIKEQISQIVGQNVKIVEPAELLITKLKNMSENLPLDNSQKEEYWVTDFPDTIQRLSNLFLDKDIKVKQVDLEYT